MTTVHNDRTPQTPIHNSQRKSPVCIGLLAAGVLAMATSAAAQIDPPVPTPGDARILEWDCPSAGNPVDPQNADPRPGQLRVDTYGRPWYVTTLGPTRLVRVTMPDLNPDAPGPATCNWWEIGVDEALRFTLSGTLAYVRTPNSLEQISTHVPVIGNVNTRRTYADGLVGQSDVAIAGTRVYATGEVGGLSFLQELTAVSNGPASGTASIRRWPAGVGTGLDYLEGVAIHPFDSYLVYFAEKVTNTIAEVNAGSAVSIVSGTAANVLRRWDLSDVEAVLTDDGLALQVPGGTVFGPRQISIDTGGVLWVVTDSEHVVRLDTSANTAIAYKIPSALNEPMAIDANGFIAYTTNASSKLGRLVPLAAPVSITPSSVPTPAVPGSVAFTTVNITQFTGIAPTMVQGALTLNYEDPQASVREALLPVTSAMPIGLRRDPSAGETYFYAIGSSDLKIGRATFLPGPDFAEPQLPPLAPGEGTKTGFAVGSGSFLVNGGTNRGSFEFVGYRRRPTDAVRGWMSYRNQATGAKVYTTNLSDLRFFDKKAVLSGSCNTITDCLNFKAEATDNSVDTFKMEKNPLPVVGGIVESGSLTRGYIGVWK